MAQLNDNVAWANIILHLTNYSHIKVKEMTFSSIHVHYRETMQIICSDSLKGKNL